MAGKIILLNGASSSGKSTLAAAVQAQIGEAFWHYSIDHLKAGGVLPSERIESGDFAWSSLRPAFFDGFHRSIPALASAGNNLIVEHIVEQREWMNRLLLLLEPHDVFFVGVHCPVDELERRERHRRDRRIGEARSDFEVTHTFGKYDLELETTSSASLLAGALILAWTSRSQPSAFSAMLEDLRSGSAA
jgi:chloramphenicol 3-O phosphotransferase